MSRAIRIDRDVERALLEKAQLQDVTPNDTLRRLLGLPRSVEPTKDRGWASRVAEHHRRVGARRTGSRL